MRRSPAMCVRMSMNCFSGSAGAPASKRAHFSHGCVMKKGTFASGQRVDAHHLPTS
jgi:hypothetical protein